MASSERDGLFDRFCENVSIPTAKYLTSRHNARIRIMTWSVILIMAALTAYQIYDRAVYYSTDPINVIITESDEEIGILPAMVICPSGQFRASMAYARAYGVNSAMQKLDSGLQSSDLLTMEQYRDTIVSKFQRDHVNVTSADIDKLIADLQGIYQDLAKSTTSDATSSVLARLDKIATSWQNIFPLLSAQLNITTESSNVQTTKDGIANTKDFTITDRDGYAKFREWNGQYDDCAIQIYNSQTSQYNATATSTWNQLIRSIIMCRLQPGFSLLIEDLQRLSSYSRILNLARPTVDDIVLDCKWYNSKISANTRSCNVSSIWTPLGKCFRIAPLDGINASLTSPDETEFATASGGMPIVPGVKSYLTIDQMRKNLRADKNCGTTSLRYFKTYSRAKCVWEKKMEPVETKCNCLYDRSPNYFQVARDDITLVQKTNNSALKVCSIYDTYFCAPAFVNSTDYVCPYDCEEVQPEVSVMAIELDPRDTFTRLPDGFDEKVASGMKNLSRYGGYLNASGTDQLNSMLSELFQAQMMLIEAFWWKNKSAYPQPFYLPWFKPPIGDHVLITDSWQTLLNKFEKYFDEDRNKNSVPTMPFAWNYPVLQRTDQYFASFTDLVTDIVEKYYEYLDKMTDGGSYTNQTLKPFYEELIADLKAANKTNATDEFAHLRLRVLNTFINDTMPLYKCTTQPGVGQSISQCFIKYGCSKTIQSTTPVRGRIYFNYNKFYDYNKIADQIEKDPSLHRMSTSDWSSKAWLPMSICELENLEQDIFFNDITDIGSMLLNWINNVTTPTNSSEFSTWAAPWVIYYKWLRQELSEYSNSLGMVGTGSIAEAFTTYANKTDVFLITNHYLAGSNAREDLRKAHIAVAQSLIPLSIPMLTIKARTTAIHHFIN